MATDRTAQVGQAQQAFFHYTKILQIFDGSNFENTKH
jgi:hypothetical protein